jgi:hypothetical protein
MPDATYSPEERTVMLERMRAASDTHYRLAVMIGYHQFIEPTGLINELIKACQRLHDEGVDFATSDIVLHDYEASYIGEKIGCIFGEALADPVNRRAFLAGLDK